MYFSFKLKTVLLILPMISFGFAQSGWYGNTSFQAAGTKLSDGNNYTSLFWYGGLKYQSNKFGVSLSLPVVFQEDLSSPGNFTTGLGDIYLNGDYQFYTSTGSLPDFSVSSFIKLPTASQSQNLGTGKADFQMALGADKYFNRFSLSGQFGYLFIGGSDGTNIINPFTFYISAGYIFSNRKHALILAYDSISTIYKGSKPSGQLALGYSYYLNNSLTLTNILSAGLNSTSADYSVSGGLIFKI